jgi:hypothetical protein
MRFFARRRHEREMAEEFRLHLEREMEAHKESGMTDEEARFAAQRKFGNAGVFQEECRDSRRVAFFENLWRDLSYGCRSFAAADTGVCRGGGLIAGAGDCGKHRCLHGGACVFAAEPAGA